MSRKSLIRILPVFALALVFLAGPALAQGGDLKVAIIDVQKIITESATGKAMLSELETFGKSQQTMLEGRKAEIEQLRSRISEGQLSLAQDKLTELQAELENKGIEMRRATDDATRQFRQKEQEALKKIEGRVMPVIQQVGRDEGYTMILRKFESGLIYANESIDITGKIIQMLDAAPAGS